MKKAFKKLQTIYFCIKLINWKKFFQLYNKNANTILWYYPFYREHFFTQSIEREFGIINAFIKLNIPFKLYFGKKIGKFHQHTIFFMATVHYDDYGFSNYASSLGHISKQLEAQGNLVYPTSHEALFWENKLHMHEQFIKLDIHQPKTTLINKSFRYEKNSHIDFPVLIKEPHSCSSMGIYKVNSAEELINTIHNNKLLQKNEGLIIQELLDIRKDMRVTLVGDDICLHYWRINLSDEWKPTATGYGSDVDFVSFPEKWRSKIISDFKKMNLTSAGIDITFLNDDINNEPIYLEVSPFYQPNPPILKKELPINLSYGAYKKQFLLKNSWDKRFVDIIFEIELKLVKHFLEKNKSNI